MIHFSRKRRKLRRRASVIIAVLVVILLVGMLSVQTIQTLALVRRGDDDRAKIMQSKELNELARGIDWSTAESQTLKMLVPETVSPIADGTVAVADSKIQTAILERQTLADHPQTTKIQIRFPADEPGEITTSWETDRE